MKRLTAAALAAAIVILLQGQAAFAAHVENLNTIGVGDNVPAFSGKDLDGSEVDFGALLGNKVVVLAFWSIYCKPCVEEISSLIRLQDELGGENLEVIGINADSELGIGRIQKFISRFEEFEKRKINYRMIYDRDNSISRLLGVGFLPTVLSVNISGKVEKVFVGFEEKNEQEIFDGIRALIPSAGGETAVASDSQVFSVEAIVPLCGFYGANGWAGSFTGNRDLDEELSKTSEFAHRKATKLILKEALLTLGLNLAEDTESEECLRPYGVYLQTDPLSIRDNLTNLIGELTINRLVRTQSSEEDFLGTEYRVNETATVNMEILRSELEKLGYETPQRTITFSVVNVNKLDQRKFEKSLLQQSRYIGYFSFPTYTIFTTAETFAEEMTGMDLGGLRVFIEDTGEDRIELEVWR